MTSSSFNNHLITTIAAIGIAATMVSVPTCSAYARDGGGDSDRPRIVKDCKTLISELKKQLSKTRKHEEKVDAIAAAALFELKAPKAEQQQSEDSTKEARDLTLRITKLTHELSDSRREAKKVEKKRIKLTKKLRLLEQDC